MKNSERILINSIAGNDIDGETAALCGSIQNYRRYQKKHGRILTFQQSAREWKQELFLPIVSKLKNENVEKNEFTNAFFHDLYKAEGNDFKVEESRNVKQVKEKGLKALLHHLIA